MKILNLNQIEKTRERLLELNKLKGHRVEVLDTLTNETSVYSSIREAARSISVDPSSLQKVLKPLQQEEVSRLIRKRYAAKKIAKDQS